MWEIKKPFSRKGSLEDLKEERKKKKEGVKKEKGKT